MQHFAHQGALAATADTGDAHEPLEGDVDR